MTLDRRLVVCAVASVAGHVAFARGLAHLPRRTERPAGRVVSIRVVEPPPAEPQPEPAKVAEPAPAPAPQPPTRARPRVRPTMAEARPARPTEAPPPDQAPVPGAATGAAPVFGVTMESTSQASGGPSMRVGNTARPDDGTSASRSGGGTPKGGAEPVPAYEVTTMPLPQGRCAGKYTDDAKAAGVEGTVVLDLVVGENGRTRDIHVVSGLGHGLTEAAVEALKACRFSPGEKDGVAVPVRVRGFKIRFLMQDND